MKVLSLLTAASAASAHTIFVALEAGGTTNPVGHGVRAARLDSPIQNVGSNDMACNGASNSVMSTDKIINVEAGSTVRAVWRHTLQSGPNDVMDASHKGPTIAYLKKVDNALTDSGVGGGWFKIQEDGHSNGQWGTSTVISNGGLHSITIPKCLPNGQYLLRAEMIALHGAGSSGGAQLYMECAQINITGGTGSAVPSKTVSFPGAYKANDPGLLISIYTMTPASKYIVPGPEVFTCSGSGAVAPPASGSNNGAVTTMVTTLAAPAPAATQAPPSCQVQQWQQCGGQSFSGCNSCASGLKCAVINDYYHQCISSIL
ncbi:glycosyl hydrolase family 61-domain-containing protein [Podospora conica]|nr:glycosyl hydrolase family 61-domain-containing protein [Schizothecium conicum]